MFTAIVCDDDEIIAQGITSFIPWNEMNIELCGIAYDGETARKLIDQFHPDILISDVCMPSMSGIELTRYAKQQNNDTQAIIISGYDNFKFAQDAIRAEASNYLLKPIDEDELIECIRKCVTVLKQNETESTVKLSGMLYRKNEILSLMNEGTEGFLRVYGEKRLNEVRDACICLWIAVIDDYINFSKQLSDHETRQIDMLLGECVSESGGGAVEFEKSGGSVSFYVLAENRNTCRLTGESIIKKCRQAIADAYEGQTVTSARSEIHGNVWEASAARKELQIAIQNKFNYPPASDIVYSEDAKAVEDAGNELMQNDIADTRQIVSSIIHWNRTEVDEELDNMKKTLLANGGKSYLFMRLMTAGIFGSLMKELNRMGIDESALGIDSMEQYHRISGAGNLSEAISLLKDNIYEIIDALEEDRQHKNSRLIHEAKTFIEEHYMDHELSMDQVAARVHISPSYFSVLFKQEEKLSFTDYLINTRIRHACELLMNTDLKAYEIAEKVGYDTPAYYSTAFKKATGMSPTEYKKKHSGK